MSTDKNPAKKKMLDTNLKDISLSLSQGFTILELLITISILAIIFALAAPAMTSSIAKQRVESTVVTVASAIEEAKVESFIRRQNITLKFDSTNKTIQATDVSGDVINSYSFPERSEVTILPADVTDIVFMPSRRLDSSTPIVFTVCDSAVSDEESTTISISPITNVTFDTGVCS